MRSFPAAGWTLTHVHVEDWSNPSSARPARVLLSRERTKGYMLPVWADAFQIFGAVLIDADPGEWHPLDPRMEWRPGRIPTIKGPGRVEFITRDLLDSQRKREADRLLGLALATDSLPETAEGLLELADGLLGGHIVPIAAEMYLLRGDPTRRDRLRARFLRAAPCGPAALEPRLAEFPTFQSHRALADAVRLAVSDALREPVDSRAWAKVRDETLARWWLRRSMSRDQVTITDMARKLGVDAPTLRSLLRKGPLAEIERLPTKEQMLVDLAAVEQDIGADADADAALAGAHQPRIALFARHLAALERLTGSSDRLARWVSALPSIVEQREWMGRLNDAAPWERAHQGSEELRRALPGLNVREPVTTTHLLDSFGAALAGAALASPALLCASSVSHETGPIIALAPGRGIGAMRFAIAHQLGHILDPDTDGASQPCALAEAELDHRGGPRESFANAFAVYLLAPRRAVVSQVGSAHIGDPEVLVDVAADVAMVFGLSAGAALRHVLNCMNVRGAEFDEILGRALGYGDWRERRQTIDDDVESSWAADRTFVNDALGAVPGWSVEAALRRPSATRFDELAKRAAAIGLLDRADVNELLRA